MSRESLEGRSCSNAGYTQKDRTGDSTGNHELVQSHDEIRSARAIEIAGEGNYAKIIDSLRQEGLLDKESERVRHVYALDKIPFLTKKDGEMFTVLELYDVETARHCLDTYRIAQDKMSVEILPGVILEHLLQEDEGISLEQFYRACLFHDIGKVEVIRQVIQHEMGDGAMLGCLHRVYHDLYVKKRIPGSLGLTENPTNAALAEALEVHRIRPIYLVPAREVLSEKDLTELKRFGLSGDETLMEIIMKHEQVSGDILKAAGFPVEAYLAAHHHNYNREPLQYPIAVGTLHISIDFADILHMADVTEAVSSLGRKYRNTFSIPQTMRVIVEHVEDGKISPFAAYLWLTDELRKYEDNLIVSGNALNDRDVKNLAFVRSFLEKENDMLPLKQSR